MKKVGFIGLGVMGSNMAKNLINHVDQLNIISRNSKKRLSFISKLKKNKKLKIFDKLEDLTKQSNIIISCVGNDRDLKDIFLTKKGIINYVSKNTVIIDHTTASAEITEVFVQEIFNQKMFIL